MKKFFKRVAAHVGDFQKISSGLADFGKGCEFISQCIQKFSELLEPHTPQE